MLLLAALSPPGALAKGFGGSSKRGGGSKRAVSKRGGKSRGAKEPDSLELQLRGEHETNCAAAAALWPVAESSVGDYDGGWERFAVPADAVAPGNAPYSKSLLVRSRAPLLPPATCDALVAELEVELAAGRSDARYPLAGYTREARVADMAAGRTLLSDALVDRILPAAADQFGFRADRLRVNEALVVKYDAASGHNALPVHADFSLLTVNVGLSDSGEYGGGGTWFQHDGAVINCEQGHALVHAGGLVHAGVPVTRGTRHVLVLFLVGAEHPMLSGRMQAVGAAAGAKPVLGGAPREPRDLALSVAMLERAVKANPCELESWSQLGWNRRHAGDHAEALRCFEKAAALSGGRDFSALAEAASSQLALGRNDDALESARRALEVGPPPGPAETDERLEVTLRAGLALLALERHEEAGVVLDSILDEAPENSEAWAALGVAMAALGQEEAALSCQRQVLRIRAAEEYGSADAAREAEASDLAVEVATLPPLPDGRELAIESAKIVDAGTGGKLWLSAAVLCSWLSSHPDVVRGAAVLELGCGTGAVGLYAAALGASRVALTDGGPPALLQLARANADANAQLYDGEVVVRPLEWGAPLGDLGDCDVVLASDVTYAADALPALASTLRALADGGCRRILVAHERRVANDDAPDEKYDGFVAAAAAAGLGVATLHTESVGERRVLVLEVGAEEQ